MLAAALLQTAPASAVPVQGCPEQEIMPVADVRKGMTGTGLSVYEGRDPEPFTAEVLGVLEDGVAPGRDMIVVELGGDILDKAGGIWFGMSGSPVYVDGKLLGAVAWGLTFSESKVGGLTAAEDMVKVLGYPESEPEAGSQSSASSPGYSRQTVRVSPRMERSIARRSSATQRQVEGGFRQLLTPFSMSGLSDPRIERVREVVRDEGLPLFPHRGAAAAAQGSTTQIDPNTPPLEPGDSFAAALSYGDVTSAGIGTTTMVCNGKALAFGHPFSFEGETFLGANHADAVTIVNEPVFSPYKLANVKELVGVVDQDRLAAIRSDLGEGPVLIPVTSTLTALNTGQIREGETRVVESEILPFITLNHLIGNIDSVFDQISGGTASLSWTINGVGDASGPFTLTRDNVYASEFDIAFDSGFEVLGNLATLFGNEFEEVAFTGVDVDLTLTDEIEMYRIHDVLVSLNGGDFLERRRLRARPGDRIGMRVVLLNYEEDEERLVDLEVRIPSKTRGEAVIEISGGSAGGPGEECFFFGENCESNEEVDSLEALITALENSPHNNELLARLRSGRKSKVTAQDSFVLEQVVSGFKRVRIRLARSGRGGGDAVPEPKPGQID
ncbi:MAG TPA: SpoIVB peptidase S55 domain-containing protein [Actinomycetota bacterium]|nr:SpoIVB peptidase S55 domain-containing protein [Actinomycetota bacterium]